MSLSEVILRATYNPARMIGREGQFGGLRPGLDEDAAVFELQSGPVCYADSQGETLMGGQHLEPLYTIRRGRLMEGRADPASLPVREETSR
jgi:predicted amidohydrolase